MIKDVRQAYFCTEATRDIFIELPEEDEAYGKGDLAGKLKLCLYGTRDAALNWQQTLSEHLLENGFKRYIGFPSVFHHPVRDVWTSVHGDEYCCSGNESALLWLGGVLSKKYELKIQKVGPLPGMSLEGQILKRLVHILFPVKELCR